MGQALEQVESKPTRRVLIIDDEDYVRQYMSLMIGSWGYEVAGCDKIQADDGPSLAARVRSLLEAAD